MKKLVLAALVCIFSGQAFALNVTDLSQDLTGENTCIIVKGNVKVVMMNIEYDRCAEHETNNNIIKWGGVIESVEGLGHGILGCRDNNCSGKRPGSKCSKSGNCLCNYSSRCI